MKPLDLLRRLSEIQSNGDGNYAAGLFPSQRIHRYLPYCREDDNIFFTASIAFILKNLKPMMGLKESQITNSILDKAIANYPSYRHKEGIPTYNFFATGRDRHFPNGRFIHRHYTFRPADDADDTALIYLTKAHGQRDTIWLKDKLAQHANGSQRWMHHNLSQYRHLRAYSTFFGKDMYIDLDVCVLCNVLYWVYENKLALNEHDRDSIRYIKMVLENRDHLNHPFEVAPSYPYPVHILYHVARLMARQPVSELEELRAQLLQEATTLLQKSNYLVEKVILATTVLRLGGTYNERCFPSFKSESDLNEVGLRNYDLFYVNPLAYFSHPLLRKIDHWTIFHMRCHCLPLYLTYILEYIYESEKYLKPQNSLSIQM